jgi:phosphoribosylamine--glycine ligase
MRWADFIFCTDNSRFHADLAPYFRRNYPILGATLPQANLELDRECGINLLNECGIDTLPYEVFTNWKAAIAYVEKTGERYVSKPWGGNPDKSLSYVSNGPADMIFKLQRWAQGGAMKGKILLQQAVEGTEMAVGAWLHRFGACEWLNENWEEKRLMNDGLGVNTGEMGTVMRYTRASKLYRDVLEPCVGRLVEMGYRGYVDMNCIVGKDGTPWPLEFTMRPGWPHFNLCLALHQGDPVTPLAALLEGRDELKCSPQTCVGVVMSHGDFPYGNFGPEMTDGFPLTGLPPTGSKSAWLSSVMECWAPVMSGSKVKMAETVCTAGEYVLIATGLGATVEAARKSVYKTAWEINWPSNRMFRTDIGKRLEKGLPKLQRWGYAEGMEYA